MDNSITLISPAKLNLFLHINRKRGPSEEFAGYHELQTIFQMLDRGDKMDFEATKNTDIVVTPSIENISLEENLVYKAAIALQQKYQVHKGAKIHLDKVLPMGGGLGGGSSNAATTILALNHLWNLNLSTNELASLGATLGADVPVFIHGKTAWAEGIGEQITPIDITENWYLIITPNCHVSTAEIFSHQGLTRDTPKQRIAPALEGHIYKHFKNDFEIIVSKMYPEIQKALNWLNHYGQGKLTGSGACCFCQFNSKAEAQQVLNEAKTKFKGFIAKGVNLSPAIQKLNEAEAFATNHS